MPRDGNNLPDIKRYITTHDPDGQAIFISHSQLPDYIPSKPIADEGDVALLYATESTPVSTEDEADIAAYDYYLHTRPGLTTPQGTVLRTIDLQPGKWTPMHRTVSVDYGVVLEGEVQLVLDSGQSRVLRRGDVSVQRGTAHSFRNLSCEKWCRLLFVFLPMYRLTIKEKVLGEEVYDEGYEPEEGSNYGCRHLGGELE